MTSPAAPSSAEALGLGGADSVSEGSATPRGRRWVQVLRWLFLAEVLATLLDIALGPWSVIGFEEGRNARAAMQLACGHADRLFALQYRDFCGGCTALAVVGAPLMRMMGATVAVWKLVPAGFHLALVGALGAVAVRAGRAREAGWALAVMIASPWALRELALTGWGNHAEVRVFLVGAVALLIGQRSRAWTNAAAGVVTGLAIWFAHIAMHAVPGILLLVALRKRKGLLFFLGVPLGLVPWALYLRARPTALAGAHQLWKPSELASLDALAAYLTGPLHPATLWPATGFPALDAALAVSVCAMVGLAVAGIVAGLRARSVLAGAVALSLCGFVAALVVRPDLWSDVPHAPGFSAFHLRYRAVVWPWLALGATLAARHLPPRTMWVAIPFLALGTGARALSWRTGPGPTLEAPVWSAPGRPDATVPEGHPPRRNPWSLDRMQDIEAAAVFLEQSPEPLPSCTIDHQGELGRRIGLYVRRGGSPILPQLPALSPAVVQGVAWGLTAAAGRHPERPIGSLPEAWQSAVETAHGRLIDTDPETPNSPGDCLREADLAWDHATQAGRVAASAPPPSPPPACPDEAGWTHALIQVSAERGRCPLGAGWPECG
ncbi:MAG: hypothetical protein CL927_06805 [Deltaproteobacteria bacterium]|nr:hypothetical protein [Deltaproteobacteria bacterium]